ncbi:UDP-glycosyltransferase 85A2, partial [Bienertia sinuspersici]
IISYQKHGFINKSVREPHAVCIPYPALAKVRHAKDFHITFVNTEYNHKRLLRSHGPEAVANRPSSRFETIPDGLPVTNEVDSTQDIPSLCISLERHGLSPFKEVLARLNNTGDLPPVSCVVSDGAMFFTLDAAKDLGVPEVLLWTASACGLLGYAQFPKLVELGIHTVLESLSPNYPPLYALGPFQLMLDCVESNDEETKSISASLWKEDPHCLEWLDSHEPNSVVYVNYGSITVMKNNQFIEFAWGLANTNLPFLWITWPDLITGNVYNQSFWK